MPNISSDLSTFLPGPAEDEVEEGSCCWLVGHGQRQWLMFCLRVSLLCKNVSETALKSILSLFGFFFA